MYNRYIPQGDGTFQRNRIPEPHPPRPPRPEPPPCPPPEKALPTGAAWAACALPAAGTALWTAARQRALQCARFFSGTCCPKTSDTGDLLMLLIFASHYDRAEDSSSL